MLKVIKNLLLKVVDDIDTGNTNLSEEDAIKVANSIRILSRKDEPMSKYSACEYIGVCRATFDKLTREYKYLEGKHVIGFKEKFWYQADLDRYLRETNNKELINTK